MLTRSALPSSPFRARAILCYVAVSLVLGCAPEKASTTLGEPWLGARFPIVVTSEATIELLGSNFGEHGTVLLGESPANVVSWSNAKVIIEAPQSATNVCSTLKVVTPQGKSNPIPLGYGKHDIWVPQHNLAPPLTGDNLAVWTGKELFTLSPYGWYRFRPEHETWLPLDAKTPEQNGKVPNYRKLFWTGTSVILWLGDTGAQLDPKTGVWEPIPSEGAPGFVSGQNVAAGGNAFFVHGGLESCEKGSCVGRKFSHAIFKDGEWHAVPPSPEGLERGYPHITWTGHEFLVWGGYHYASMIPVTGGIAFNPTTSKWREIHADLPKPGLEAQRVLWLAGHLLVIGSAKSDSEGNPDAWLYNLRTNQWRQIDDGQYFRKDSEVVVVGRRIIVTGGRRLIATGPTDEPDKIFAIYSLDASQWRTPEIPEFISTRLGHVAFSDGASVFVIGGRSNRGMERGGGRYDLANAKWTLTGTLVDEPILRSGAYSAWTGSELLVYGNGYPFIEEGARDGGRYNPATDTWVPLPENTRTGFFAAPVWTGSKLFVWGGRKEKECCSNLTADGALYDPRTNAWKTVSNIGTPVARASHSVVAAGRDVIVWGGRDDANGPLNDGASYNIKSGVWSVLPATGAPNWNFVTFAVWTGMEMLVFGDRESGAYNPQTHQWRAIQGGIAGDCLAYAICDFARPPTKVGEYVYFFNSSFGPSANKVWIYSIADDILTLIPDHASELKWRPHIAQRVVVPLPSRPIIVDHELGIQEPSAPCGFFPAMGPHGHFVWTGDRILGWGDGGVSWYLP